MYIKEKNIHQMNTFNRNIIYNIKNAIKKLKQCQLYFITDILQYELGA